MIYEQNFKRLEKIFGENWLSLESVILKSGPFMDLHFEKIGKDTFAMAHYFEQNGDLVPDPDMEIRVKPQLKIVEALALQTQFGFQRVYPFPENLNLVNLRAKKELNQFLGMWLRNIIAQGFRFQ